MIFMPDIENVIATVMMVCRFDACGFAFLIEPEGFGMPEIEDQMHEAEKLNLEPW
jgi:hypothetical protein